MKFPKIYFTISTFCVLRNPSLTKAMIILSYTHIMFYLSHKSFIYIKLIFFHSSHIFYWSVCTYYLPHPLPTHFTRVHSNITSWQIFPLSHSLLLQACFHRQKSSNRIFFRTNYVLGTKFWRQRKTYGYYL